ncbi:uncharacterized protein TNCT_85201 [Trichonephila clavata]|uniref:Selenoprotein S n=1 Tax=Trichonephila clavata TaxID=2740835 RepID=A0A8X6H0M9_TRICU|nr:uncharacterized protein TNCT_85201 [Trichonephila clavata]
MDVPPNPTSDPVQSIFDQITGVLSAYGWTILFILVVANLIWSHLYPKYRRWRERLEEQEMEAEYKKDPSRIIARDEAMARARQKMQEEHDRLAQEHEEKMKEKERQKREEKLAAMESLAHGKPKPSNNSSSLRQEYNPLMGTGGSSSCYRPPRRGASGGG